MKTVHLNLIALLLIVVSCGEKKQSEKDALLDKVMAVHDEVMPKMSDIMRLKKELTSKIDELEAAGESDNAARIDELKNAVEDLENSRAGMMNWMRGFDPDFEGMVQDEVMQYLNDQMAKIEKVSREMTSALKNAEEMLSE